MYSCSTKYLVVLSYVRDSTLASNKTKFIDTVPLFNIVDTDYALI
jgi:hypothetical protein